VLDIVFALNRRLNFFVLLKVNEPLDGVSLRESCDQSIPMFVDSSNKVVRYPDIQMPLGALAII
jgi:hypothetical protein